MTTCHRLTHRHKAFTLDTYETNSRWSYGAAMAVDKVSSDGVELSCVASDKVAKTFRLGRSMAASLSRKEAAAMAQRLFCKSEFMRGYFFGRRWRTNHMTVPSQLPARNYHGTRPCIPADALMAICRRIFNRTTKKQS